MRRLRTFLVAVLVAVIVGGAVIVPNAQVGLSAPDRRSTRVEPAAAAGVLKAVSAVSSTDAWAVGANYTETGSHTFILHWDGATWSKVKSPNPRTDNTLNGVSAISSTDVWAVGTSSAGPGDRTLILHWDGVAWTTVESPNPRTMSNILHAVTAISSSDAWAVGTYHAKHDVDRTLILHWDGATWSKVRSPNPGPAYNDLHGVSARSPADAWAVGIHDTRSGVSRTLLLHWDGTVWSRVESPSPGPYYGELLGVDVIGSKNAWAVGGYYARSGEGRTLIVRRGAAWSRVESPSPGRTGSGLLGVSAVSSKDAWAVGGYDTGSYSLGTLVLHWDGSAWSRVRSPSPGTDFNQLNGVSAVSSTDAWAVGDQFSYERDTGGVLILHWDGTAWSKVKSSTWG